MTTTAYMAEQTESFKMIKRRSIFKRKRFVLLFVGLILCLMNINEAYMTTITVMSIS